jgi:hypothetical protein
MQYAGSIGVTIFSTTVSLIFNNCPLIDVSSLQRLATHIPKSVSIQYSGVLSFGVLATEPELQEPYFS